MGSASYDVFECKLSEEVSESDLSVDSLCQLWMATPVKDTTLDLKDVRQTFDLYDNVFFVAVDQHRPIPSVYVKMRLDRRVYYKLLLPSSDTAHTELMDELQQLTKANRTKYKTSNNDSVYTPDGLKEVEAAFRESEPCQVVS